MPQCAAILLAILVVVAGASPSIAEDAPDFAKGGIPFLKKHCVECHSGKQPKAELALDVFPDSLSIVKQRKVWDNVLRMIATGDMPPKAKPRPTVAEAEQFTDHVKAVFDHADRHAKPDPGRVTMRRLNRQEYTNTVRDLLWVDFNPTEDFPADDVGHGFDNIGDVLSLSPLLMERYLDAAETITNRVIMVNPPAPARRYLAGKYLQPNTATTPQGRFRPLNPTAPEPFNSGPYTAGGDYLKFSGDADLIVRANLYAETKSPSPVKVALFLSGAGVTDPSPDAEVDQLMGANVKALKPIKIVKIFDITAREAKDSQQIEFPYNHLGVIQRVGLGLIKPPAGEEPAQLFIEHIWSVGPLETRPLSHVKILATTAGKPQPEQTVEVLTRFLRRAYRRPPTAEELARHVKLVENAVAAGEKWESGIQQAIQAVLCSPKFLFRVELDDRPQSPETQPLDEFQLASRLAYFLWSTMPDDELLDLAEKKQLTANLAAQVKRMLADPKSSSLVENFALQWLQIKRLKSTSPDTTLFPQFTDVLRTAMLQESRLFFDAIMREDRSVLDLVDADFTFLNEPLARLYGIDDTNGNLIGQKVEKPGGQPIRGEEFKRVSLQGKARGGLLTQASVLTVTSNPTRTSPVKRGRWVLEQILGAPPPPPPPNVPELPEDKQAAAGGTLKERMEIHRKNPACANCHAKMDPIGFALENFNGIGEFRVKDGTFDIDPSGEFADGTKVKGPEELKTLIRGKKELFARCLAEKMLIYALGRGLEYYDRPTVDKIVTSLSAGNDKFSVLITEIVQSEPFRLRRGSSDVE